MAIALSNSLHAPENEEDVASVQERKSKQKANAFSLLMSSENRQQPKRKTRRYLQRYDAASRHLNQHCKSIYRKGDEVTPILMVETSNEKNAKLARKAANLVTVCTKSRNLK